MGIITIDRPQADNTPYIASRREALAIAAMQALIASPSVGRISTYELANRATKQADALIEALDKDSVKEK